jgi:arylsulfatase A-like enzyme
VERRLLEAIDVAPTLISLAGAAVPPKMQGRPFLGPSAAPPRRYAFGARDRCDETLMRLRTVRDDRYRYIRNFMPEKPFLSPNAYKAAEYPLWTLLPKLHAEGRLTPAQAALCAPSMPPEELYDLHTDPHEIHNLAADPRHAAKLRQLRAVLEEWIRTTDDQGRFPETPEAM